MRIVFPVWGILSLAAVAYAGNKDDIVFSPFPTYMGYYFLFLLALFLVIQKGRK